MGAANRSRNSGGLNGTCPTTRYYCSPEVDRWLAAPMRMSVLFGHGFRARLTAEGLSLVRVEKVQNLDHKLTAVFVSLKKRAKARKDHWHFVSRSVNRTPVNPQNGSCCRWFKRARQTLIRQRQREAYSPFPLKSTTNAPHANRVQASLLVLLQRPVAPPLVKTHTAGHAIRWKWMPLSWGSSFFAVAT